MGSITRETTELVTITLSHDLSEKYIYWEQVLHGKSATLVGTRLYLLGAWREGAADRAKDVLCLDLAHGTSAWESVSTPRLYSHYSFLDNDRLFIMCTRDVWTFDLLLRQFASHSLKPAAFDRPTAAVCEFLEASRELVFVGGKTGASCISYSLNVDLLTWTLLQTKGRPPSPRYGHTSCSNRGRNDTDIFVFGGRNTEESYNDLHVLRCAGRQYHWSEIKLREGVLPVAYASITYLSGMLFIYGGFRDLFTDTSQLWQYDTLDGTCTDFSGSKNSHFKRSCHTALAVQDMILVLGGYTIGASDILALIASKTGTS